MGKRVTKLIFRVERRQRAKRIDRQRDRALGRIGNRDLAVQIDPDDFIDCGLIVGDLAVDLDLHRLLSVFPPVRGALSGLILAGLLAGVVEGVSFNVLGAALATALPLTVLSCLRVLDHADDRSQPPPRIPEDALES